MVEHKLVSSTAVVALWTLEIFLLIKLIPILLELKYIQDKNYAIFTAMLRNRSYFVYEIFVPVTRAAVLYPASRVSFDRRRLCSQGSSAHTGKFSSRFPSARSLSRLVIWTHRDFYEWKSGKARSRKPGQSGRPGLYEGTLKSAFHLSSQISGPCFEAFSKTELTNQGKQYQLLRFC